MIRRLFQPGILAISIGMIAACSDGSGPSGPLLLGQWGSDVALLIAINAGAELQLGCSTAIIDEPIELIGDTFAAQARLRGGPPTLGDLPKVRVTGSVSGSTVVMVVPPRSGLPADTFNLQAGVRPDPIDAPQCPV